MDELLVTFERQRAEMAEVQQRLAATTVTVWSSDNLVRVDANTAGIPVDVHLTAEAFKRSTPDKLGRSILEAVQNAARQAGELSQQAWAPVAALAGEVPDLPDIAPGMPSIKSLVDTLFPDPVTEPAPGRADDRGGRRRILPRPRLPGRWEMSELEVDEEALQAARPAIAEVADQVADAVNAALAVINGEGECWGSDETGQKFAEKYKPAADEGLTGLDLLSQAVNGVGDGVGAVATNFGNQDESNAAALGAVAPQ
ncbi:YbaB/EbfC family nucleoid-associated protein [Nocardia sp. NPDC051750]|uniref:YbaB/EbfC family nucleoid-associated protein n=1 Tax=Nocardia sp. NPDC051750 TaxID=3364325 RepID=UPI0037BC29D1